MLVLAFAQNALHSFNHLIDVGEAEPSWLGPANLVSLVLATVLLAWMLQRGTAPRAGVRVFVAGASGAIGRPLVPRLVAAGHEVTGMTRSERGAEAIRAGGARAAVVDALDRDALRAAVQEAAPEVVVHELTALPERFDLATSTSTTRPTGCARRAPATCSTPPGPPAARRLRVPEHRLRRTRRRAAGSRPRTPPHCGRARPVRRGVRVLDRDGARGAGAEGLEGLVLRYGWFYGAGHLLRAGRADDAPTCAGGASR